MYTLIIGSLMASYLATTIFSLAWPVSDKMDIYLALFQSPVTFFILRMRLKCRSSIPSIEAMYFAALAF